jgi:hypothetical protein
VKAVSAPAATRDLRIQEVYRDYAPPINAAAIVHQLLKSVPDKYLAGLDCVVLINEGSLSRRDRIGKAWSRKRKYDKSRILGRYHGRTRSSLPYIELRVDKIISRLPGLQIYIPLLRYMVFGRVLFHEIGHHIHRTIRPEHAEREDVADNWANKLNVNFFRNKYWYAIPILIPVAKTYTFLRGRR